MTVNDILVTGTSDTGLEVGTTKNITVKNVQANNDTQDGADLSSSGKATNISVTSSQFNTDADVGLSVSTSGTITLTNVTADHDSGGGGGAILRNNLGGGGGAIILAGTNQFNYDNGGLTVHGNGSIFANNIVANNNSGYGVYMESGLSPITFTGTNSFDNNSGIGLQLIGGGNITLSNIDASDNTGDGTSGGASLDNCLWDTSKCDGTGSVTITNGKFDSNTDGDGLDVTSGGSSNF